MHEHTLDPLIEGYFSYLGQVRRLKPRTLVDLRCTIRKVIKGMEAIRPGKALWELSLEDYTFWIGKQRQSGCSSKSLAKELCHVRGLLEYARRNGRCDRNVLDGVQLQDQDRRL